MKQIMMIAVVAVCMLAGNIAQAQGHYRQDRHDRYDRRQVQNTRHGRLTPMEMRQINLMKRDLQREIRMAKADGYITAREQRSIDRHRIALDRMIYMQRRDA